MKKKDYLQQLERGALIGTSVLLLNGVVSCSFDPMDTPPTETTLTKGVGGLPGGYPGAGDVNFFLPGALPTLDKENYRYGFQMNYGEFTFHTIIPDSYNAIKIKMENSTRTITNVEVSCININPNLTWRQTGSELLIRSIKNAHIGAPAQGVIFKITGNTDAPLIMTYSFVR